MKPHFNHIRLLLAVVFLIITSGVYSQTFFGIASAPNDNLAQAGTTVTITTPPASMLAGDLVIIYAHYRGTGGGVSMSISNAAGQTWNTLATNSGSTQTYFVTWCRFNGTWPLGIGPTISNGAGTNALSATMYVYRPSNASNQWGVNINPVYSNSSNMAGNSINSVSTTMTKTVTMAFWGNAARNTWNNLVGSGWVKPTFPTGAGQIRNTQGGVGAGQSHTAAYYIQTTTLGATGAVAQDQSAGTATLRAIMSWHELTNDDCSGAIPITSGITCTNTPGSLSMATNSGVGVGACTGTADDDVWFSFVAADTLQSVTLSNINGSITGGGGGGIRTQVFSGTCGSLTSIACGTTNNTLVPNLNIGTTYYVRIYSQNATTITTAAGFNICVLTPAFFGKSFINITKGNTGGTVETGDELEIRAAIVLRGGGNALDSCSFTHTVPAGTSYVPGSLSIRTNEGKVYKAFTDALLDDEGEINGSSIKFNLGYDQTDNPSTQFRRGRITSGDVPQVGGGTLMLATYRVTVTQTLNNTINLGGGTFTYSLPSNPTAIFTKTFGNNIVRVYINDGLCDNATGVNVLANNLAGDFTGTFGSGNTMNRIQSPNVPSGLIYTEMKGNDPGDFFYSITNNTSRNSAGFSTVNTWPKPQSPATNRVYGVFDVIGDHTNATNQVLGNSAADTTGGQTGGYMMLVNAAYNLDTVFKYPISGLCPNTYYEISSWIRNICSRCGVDSVGRGASGVSVPAGYIPTAPNDSSGVYPNISFSVDGVNHYTSGNVTYSGQWLKKGFTFLTGPAQTNITLAIANNAPGGGGNDWLLDDIQVSTCLPGLTMRPSNTPTYCLNASVDLSVAVSTFYNNYTTYQWERNTGSGWGPAPEMPGVQTFSYTYAAPNYLDTVSLPTFLLTAAMDGYQYRIRTATTLSNLADDDCSIYNVTDIITLNQHPTCDVLPSEVISFAAELKTSGTLLTWAVKDEGAITAYDVERSNDGRSFTKIGTVQANGSSTYNFTDDVAVSGKAYYRLRLVTNTGGKFSNIVTVMQGRSGSFEIVSVTNPFAKNITGQINSSAQRQATLTVLDMYGRILAQSTKQINKGFSSFTFETPSHLQSGNYILRIVADGFTVNKLLIKQ
jgi:trimeric autotransporter adhesin